MLALIVAAGCSPAMPKRPPAISHAEIQKKAKAGDIEYPNEDLAEKHKAAKASPESYAAVYPYARSVTEYCLASLYETDCDTCKDGAVKRKPPSELDPKTWVLVENAKQMLDTLLKQDLPAEQAEEVSSPKGGCSGWPAAPRTRRHRSMAICRSTPTPSRCSSAASGFCARPATPPRRRRRAPTAARV
jgi:hypothetical protein